MTMGIHSSRSKQHTGTLLDLLVDNAAHAAKELYRRIIAHNRTQVMMSVTEREGGYYLVLAAGPLISEEAVFVLMQELVNNRGDSLKTLRSYGATIQDETEDTE